MFGVNINQSLHLSICVCVCVQKHNTSDVDHTDCCFWQQKFQIHVFKHDEHSENSIWTCKTQKNPHLSLNICRKKKKINFWKNLSDKNSELEKYECSNYSPFLSARRKICKERGQISGINDENTVRITIISQNVRNCLTQPALFNVHVQMPYI